MLVEWQLSIPLPLPLDAQVQKRRVATVFTLTFPPTQHMVHQLIAAPHRVQTCSVTHRMYKFFSTEKLSSAASQVSLTSYREYKTGAGTGQDFTLESGPEYALCIVLVRYLHSIFLRKYILPMMLYFRYRQHGQPQLQL